MVQRLQALEPAGTSEEMLLSRFAWWYVTAAVLSPLRRGDIEEKRVFLFNQTSENALFHCLDSFSDELVSVLHLVCQEPFLGL